jgi:hypothetical protein
MADIDHLNKTKVWRATFQERLLIDKDYGNKDADNEDDDSKLTDS